MTERKEDFELIWGADEIARAIGRTTRATYHMLENGKIRPAQNVGGRWVVERGALVRFFMGEAA